MPDNQDVDTRPHIMQVDTHITTPQRVSQRRRAAARRQCTSSSSAMRRQGSRFSNCCTSATSARVKSAAPHTDIQAHSAAAKRTDTLHKQHVCQHGSDQRQRRRGIAHTGTDAQHRESMAIHACAQRCSAHNHERSNKHAQAALRGHTAATGRRGVHTASMLTVRA
jgi:hypothetical protein